MHNTRRLWIGILGVLSVIITAAHSHATPGPPGAHDARSVAMGGTGVAHVDNASAIFHNPASMDQIKRLSVTLSFSPSFPTATSPFLNFQTGDVTTRTSEAKFVPYFLAAAAYRVLDRVVIGAGAYLNSGFGSSYKNVPEVGGEDIQIVVGTLEFQVPVSVRVTKALSVGVGIRFGYIMQDAELVVPGPGGVPTRLDIDMSGYDGPGLMAGVLYQPNSQLRLGLSYRSKMNLTMDGTSAFPDAGNISAESSTSFAIADEIRAGGAYSLLGDRLLLVGEAFVRLHDRAHDELVTKTEGQPQDQVTPLDWRNSFGGRVGIEVLAHDRVPVRVGYAGVNSATPKGTAGNFFPPPGILHAVSFGTGYRHKTFSVDAAFQWAFGNEKVTQDDLSGSPVNRQGVAIGTFKSSLPMFSLSATFHR